MPDEIPQPPASEAEKSPTPKDLRGELGADLKSEFTANISAAGTDSETQAEIASAVQNFGRKKELHELNRFQRQDLFPALPRELKTANTRVHELEIVA